MTDKPLSGRIVLVTGASRGIGYHAALEAGRQGAQVIAVARTVGGLEELDDEIQKAGGQPATLVPQDLRDGDAIDRLGAAIFERWGRLDGLVGSAAMQSTLSPLAHVDPKEFDRTFTLNVTANYRLIRSMDLLLRQSASGRALFLTSPVAAATLPYWSTFAASKAALEMLVKTYAVEVRGTPVRVNLMQPRPVRSALRAKAFPGEDPDTLPSPATVAADIVRLISPGNDLNGHLFDQVSGETRPVVTYPA